MTFESPRGLTYAPNLSVLAFPFLLVHAELKPYGIGVTVLCLGTTSTSFGSVADQRNTAVLRMLMMEPHSVASTGIRAMLNRRSSVVAGILNKIIAFSNRATPRTVQRMVMGRVMSGW